MTRIGFADHLFLRMHHGIGNPVFNQFLWRFDEPIADCGLEKLHHSLSGGLLSRAVVSPVLPTARHRWVASDAAHPLYLEPEPVETDGIRAWAQSRIARTVDPERGVGWQLAAASLADGGCVVSLVCSHMVADGSAMIAAVRQANRDGVGVTSADLGVTPSVRDSVVDDLRDTVGQLTPIVKWAAGRLGELFGRSVESSAPTRVGSPPRRRTARPSLSGNESWTPPYVVVECSASEWKKTAAEWGGTSNSLFIAVLTAVSEALGRATPGDELRWSLPFSARDVDDLDSNSTKIIPVWVPVADPSDRDLTRIRKVSKSAFTDFAARQASGVSNEPIPLPLIQMLPDVLVAKIPVPADGSEGLCSNLGHLPVDFTTIGDVHARSVAARATFAGADAAFARTLGGGSTAWVSETDETITITVHGMDPDRMRSDDDVRSAVEAALGRWDLTGRFW